MSLRLHIAFAVLWLACSGALSAQVGFSMPFINGAETGTNKNLPVKVTNFDSIVSMQFVIRWNPSVLKYYNIAQFGLPGLDITDFNVQRALDSGYVRLLWEGPNSFPGVSVPDGNTIFRLSFTVIGQDTSSSPVKLTQIIDNFPTTEFEIVKVISPDSTLAAFNAQQCNITQGFVAVGFTVATEEPNIQNPLTLKISPNPFSNNTYAEFYLEQSTNVQALVADATGRILFTKDMPQLPSGKHAIDIDKAIFQAKGAYFMIIRAGSQMSVRPMICY